MENMLLWQRQSSAVLGGNREYQKMNANGKTGQGRLAEGGQDSATMAPITAYPKPVAF
mgnify:CR=1 FL=1